jgi:hypothetical protein
MSDNDRLADADAIGLGRIADFCQLGLERTGVGGVAVTFASAHAGLELVHATNELTERVAELEFTLGQGPATDTMSSGHATAVDDLTSRVSGHRWPLYAPEAADAGVRAVQAYPILLEQLSLGCVGFFSDGPTHFSTDQHRQALALTELIGLALVHPSSGPGIGSRLRMSVHQAAGMVMVQTGCSIGDALVLLRATAFTEDVKLTDLAADVVDGRRRFGKVGTNVRE